MSEFFAVETPEPNNDGAQGVPDRGEEARAAGVASGEDGPEARPFRGLRVLLYRGLLHPAVHHEGAILLHPHVAR